VYWRIFRRGLSSGLQITLELAKAIVPVYFIITFLKYSPLLDILSQWCKGFMAYLGLPGEAALPLVIGNALNLYPAVGAIEALSLTGKQITIIAVMLLFSHSLFVEMAVTKKAGVRVLPVLALRIGLAISAGILLNYVL
jgi:spore maturation protein SpmB